MKKWMASLIRAFRFDVKLRQKLLVSYLAIIVVPFAILGVFVARKISRIVEERITYSTERAFEQAAAFLEYKLYNVKRVSHLILMDTVVNDILRKDLGSYALPDQLKDMAFLTALFFSYQDGESVDRVKLYVRDPLIYAEEGVNLLGLAAAKRSPWYGFLEKSGDQYAWCPSEYLGGEKVGGSEVLSLARLIPDLRDLRTYLAVLRVDFKKSMVADILKKSTAVSDSVTYVVNGAGDVVASSDAAEMERSAPFVALMRDMPVESGGLHRIHIGRGDALVGAHALSGTDWRMMSVIPFKGIGAQSALVRNQIFLVILAIAAAAYVLAYFISGSVTRRLSLIVATMEGVKHGSLKKLSLPAGTDEVGELADTYNLMVDEITALMATQERVQRELKGAELKALQAQINPHFLYNTLDMIKWMSRKGMADEIEELLNSLAIFYRLALSEGKEIIPLREELRHVELYAHIQNVRYRGAIHFVIQVEESALDYGILKVTLQPLVENAIVHGIIEKPEKRGRILVSGARNGDELCVSVEDDGVGIPPAILERLLDPDGAHAAGFGVRNIHERFRLYYGEKYGLTFKSAPGKGTTATVTWKARRV